MKDLLNQMNQNRITATSDGLLRDMVVRGLYRQAYLACDEAIARRNREIEALGDLRQMIADKFDGGQS